MKIRLNLLPVALVLGILAASIGCKNDDDEEPPPPPPPPVNNIVIALVSDPGSPQQNEVEIRYSLIDADSNIASVLVEYSTNGGITFLVNTPTEFTGVGSSGTFPLATSPFPGVSHKFVWDTWADLGAASGTQYMVRITPSDSELGVDGQTPEFTIDNSIKAPPVAVINSSSPPPPPAILAGDVRVDYQLFDNLSWPATVVVDVSTNGGASYQTASEATGTVSQGLFNLTTSPTGAPHVFVWDSVQDVVGFASVVTCLIRITPSDAQAVGSPGLSGLFDVDNRTNTVPTAVLQTPPTPPAVTGNVNIDYDLIDDDSDRISITVRFSTNGGTTWAPASRGSGSDPLANLISSPFPGTPHLFVWNSLANLGATQQTACRIRITPSDGVLGVFDETANFEVNNLDMTRPQLTIISSVSLVSTEQRIVMTFNDSLDPASVILGVSAPATIAVVQDNDTTLGGDPCMGLGAGLDFSELPGTLTFELQNRRVIYYPNQAFAGDQQIRLLLTEGITDVAGNPLLQDSPPIVPSDTLSLGCLLTAPAEFEQRWVPPPLPECDKYLADPNSDIWFYDFDTFGTFDSELGALGLRGSDAPVNAVARDRVMAQVLYTLSDKYGREPTDGSAISGAYRISFVCRQPLGTVEVDYNRMCVGLDRGGILGTAWLDSVNNGRKEDDCSTSVPLGVFSGGINGSNSRPGDAISPAVGTADLRFLDGSYSQGTGTPQDDLRHMAINDLIWDWGNALGIVGSHETGHSVGLQHDDTNSLNIMRPSASPSFLSSTNTRFSSGSRAVLDGGLGLVP